MPMNSNWHDTLMFLYTKTIWWQFTLKYIEFLLIEIYSHSNLTWPMHKHRVSLLPFLIKSSFGTHALLTVTIQTKSVTWIGLPFIILGQTCGWNCLYSKNLVVRHFDQVLDLRILSVHGMTPQYLSELLTPFELSRQLRSSDQHLLTIPAPWLKLYGDIAFSVAAPKAWNSSSLYIRTWSTLHIFKKPLKTHLFKQYLVVLCYHCDCHSFVYVYFYVRMFYVFEQMCVFSSC